MGAGELELWKLSVPADRKVFEHIYSFISSDDPKIAWRSAWIIDNVTENNPELLVPLIPDIINQFLETQNGSLKRHFTRMLCRHTVPEEFLGKVVNRCFDLLSPLEPTAVRVFAMQLLFNIAQQQPALKQELALVVEGLLEEGGTTGFKNRAEKLLKLLRR